MIHKPLVVALVVIGVFLSSISIGAIIVHIAEEIRRREGNRGKE